MTMADRLRQAVTVLLVAGLLVLSPALASARFTDTAGVMTVPVGTKSLSSVTSAGGSFNCFHKGRNAEQVDVTFTRRTGEGTAGTNYRYSIWLDDRPVGTPVTSPNLPVTLGGEKTDQGVATTWTLQVTSVLGTWTGPAWTKTITCPAGNSDQHNDF